MKTEQHIVDNPPVSSLTADVVDEEDPPLVSFCVPTYNNEDIIGDCLGSYASQDYPNLEIIVVDNGSTDATVEIAEEYADEIYFDDGGIGSVRQTSVEESDGEILGLFDSDIVLPDDGWVSRAVRYFNYADDVSTVWPANEAPPDSPPTTHVYFNLWHAIIEDRIAKNRGPYGGGNALFRRDAIEDIGGVDRSLHYVEDLDWAKRLQEAGYRVVYIRDPIYHYTMLGFATYAKKQFMAANQFTRAGGEVTGLPVPVLVYEQAVVGTFGMVKGLLVDRDPVWLLFPALLLVRAVAFLTALVNIGAREIRTMLSS